MSGGEDKESVELSGKDISFLVHKIKKNHVMIFLILFVLFGLYLRSYHLGFPYIGYHNMKEHETLDPTYFFISEGKYLHKQAFAFFGLDEKTGYHEEYGEVPMIAFAMIPIWLLFGKQLIVARILMVLFFLGSIVLTYHIVKKLTNDDFVSLLSSFFMTIMPLGIYFGQHVQPESPALFFMLLSLFFYLQWIDDLEHKNSNKNAILFTLSLAISGLFKPTFLIVLIPMAFLFPYKNFYEGIKHHRKEYFKKIGFLVLGFLPFIIMRALYEFSIVDKSKVSYRIELLRTFDSGYWSSRMPSFAAYINDNFTFWFFWIAMIGIILVCFKFRTKLGKFMIGFMIALIPYILLLSSKIAGHAYYQMPFLPMICIASAYVFYILGTTLKQITSKHFALYIPLILILLTVPALQDANDRVYGTLFYGQDYLGQYIKEHTNPGDRLITYAPSQEFAICSYAERRCGSPYNLTHFKRVEQVFNIPYVVISASEWNRVSSDPEVFNYISQNYHLELVGGVVEGNQIIPITFLLQRPGSLNISIISSQQPKLAVEYDFRYREGNSWMYKKSKIPYYVIENKVQ